MEYAPSTHVGIDESGRGSLYGPVFAAAVLWDPTITHPDLRDSKQLSRKKRETMRTFIEKHAIAYAVASVDNIQIDESNILQATHDAMHNALDQINESSYSLILVDGNNFRPYHSKTHTCVVKGDNKFACIAAASILAKVYHDEWILASTIFYEKDVYDLRNNMGYGTIKHRHAIQQHGITQYHRKSFVKNVSQRSMR